MAPELVERFIQEVEKGFTIQQATQNLGYDWYEVTRMLDDIDIRTDVVYRAIEARAEREMKKCPQ